jgi:uncharacterized protein YndB with AHSA1/START domain
MHATAEGSAKVTLPADDQILISREFAAPPRLVWRAITEPELVRRWWPGKRGEMVSCEIDLRVGGRWRYLMTAGEGFEVGFHGEYRELVPGERLVTTEVFEGMPDGYAVNTVTLTDLGDGRTRLDTLVQHQNQEHRDGHINSGMEGGMQESYDLLDQVAQSLA